MSIGRTKNETMEIFSNHAFPNGYPTDDCDCLVVKTFCISWQMKLQILMSAPSHKGATDSAYSTPFFQWAQQHNCLGLELPDQLPDISPGGLQWRLGSHKSTELGVGLYKQRNGVAL